MIEALPDLVNANPALVRRGRWTHAKMLIEIGERGWIVVIDGGQLSISPEKAARCSSTASHGRPVSAISLERASLGAAKAAASVASRSDCSSSSASAA